MSYDYRVIRSARRTVAIEVTREAEVIVRAPFNMRADDISRFVEEHEKWIMAQLIKQRRRAEIRPEPTDDEKDIYIKMAEDYFPRITEYYANIMGLEPAGIKITGAKKRFGSCNANNVICFSWRLMQYPEKAIDYVVVHELAHIKHKNHGKEFYECIEDVMPDYKERVKILKE